MGIRSMQLHNPVKLGWHYRGIYLFPSPVMGVEATEAVFIAVVFCVVQGYSYACPRPVATIPGLFFRGTTMPGANQTALQVGNRGVCRGNLAIPIFHR